MDPADETRRAKRTLRREVTERIRGMDPDRRRLEERAIAERFPTLPGVEEAGTVLLFVSHIPEEVETRPMIRWSLDRGKAVLLPRVDREERILRLHRVTDLDRDLVPGAFGIPEPRADAPEVDPAEADWALIPGLAFDAAGHRLGRGAGHYDRLIPRLRPEVKRWALALGPQWIDAVPAEPHDRPVDGIVGADRLWSRPLSRRD